MPVLNLKPEIESLPTLLAFCEEQGVDDRLMLAVEEAFVNIANHSGASSVSLRCECREGEWVIVLEDDGAPFDPTAYSAPDPLRDQSLKAGGQGIHIMRAMTDSLLYQRQNGSNYLTITKSVKSK